MSEQTITLLIGGLIGIAGAISGRLFEHWLQRRRAWHDHELDLRRDEIMRERDSAETTRSDLTYGAREFADRSVFQRLEVGRLEDERAHYDVRRVGADPSLSRFLALTLIALISGLFTIILVRFFFQ